MTQVLLIDNCPGHVATISRWLADEGCEVHTASHPQAGLVLARRLRPSLILLDQFMPEMDGLVILHDLASDPRTRSIPVVMLATRSNAAAKIRALWRGAKAYLVKPVPHEELLEVVRVLAEAPEHERPSTLAASG